LINKVDFVYTLFYACTIEWYRGTIEISKAIALYILKNLEGENMIIDKISFELISVWGDNENCVCNIKADGKTFLRTGKASKKGIFNTSVYGIKLKININTKTFEEVTI
jgi:hypothetical protein